VGTQHPIAPPPSPKAASVRSPDATCVAQRTLHVDRTHRATLRIDRKERTVVAPIDWSDPDVWATLSLGAVVLLVYARRALRFLDEIL
jgi:hypothetical protein